MEKYQELINDPRLTPNLKRTRAGSTQEFQQPGRHDFVADFIIIPPARHIYAKLIEGSWYWVNGCDKCNGEKENWCYIRCEKHDVCVECKTIRKDLKEIPWGHPDGFLCKPCHQKIHDKEKAEALAKMEPYDKFDFYGLDSITCPYCNLEIDSHEHYESDNEKLKCYRCDNEFIVTANQSVTFTTRRT